MAANTRHGDVRYPVLLWTGWVTGPLAWAVHLVGGYVLVPWVCATGHNWSLHALTLATLLISGGGGWVAWKQWGVVGRRWPGSDGGRASRTRFMAAGGLTLSGLSALLIIAEAIPNFFLGACL